MYERFSQFFPQDGAENKNVGNSIAAADERHLREFFARFSGKSFGAGIYRVVSAEFLPTCEAFIAEAFPEYAETTSAFGYDWLGRVFGVDTGRSESGLAGVVMLEPGTGEVLQIPCNVQSFHEVEIVEYREAALAESFYEVWRSSGGAAPLMEECVGYKRPLFLGGSDEVENLEMSSIEVYWSVSAQLIARSRGVPAGTRISSIRID